MDKGQLALLLLSEMENDDEDTSALHTLLMSLQNDIQAQNTQALALLLCHQKRTQPDTRITGYVHNVVPMYRDSTFRSHFRMSRDAFESLCQQAYTTTVATGLTRTPLSTKLLAVLWLFSNQESFRGVADRFDMSTGTLHHYLLQVIQFLHELKPRYLRWPDFTSLTRIASNLESKYGFPGVVGCIDGSHITVKPPNEHREGFINRKGYPSINVLAICDDTMAFTYVYADRPGSCHDARVYRVSAASDIISRLAPEMHILGDSAYSLLPWLLTPYRDNGHLSDVQKRYNRIHSSTRCVIERAFGRLKGKFRRLKYLDITRIDQAPRLIEAICVLHNFILQEDSVDDSDDEEMDDMAAQDINPPEYADNAANNAGVVKRDELAQSLR